MCRSNVLNRQVRGCERHEHKTFKSEKPHDTRTYVGRYIKNKSPK